MTAVDGVTAAPILSGVLLVNKPSGPTSFDLIRWLRRGHKNLKLGHAGTLDPLASGLMILLIGNATKRQDTFMKLDKTYLCGIRLGVSTDTGDTQGKILEEVSVPELSSEEISRVCQSMLGAQSQIPPMYAAIKKDGVPLYKLARRGQTVERAPRPIRIDALKVLSLARNCLTIRVDCSSGTYVRSLAEDLSKKLGTVGCVESLKRERIGKFNLDNAYPGESLKSCTMDELASHLLEEPSA